MHHHHHQQQQQQQQRQQQQQQQQQPQPQPQPQPQLQQAQAQATLLGLPPWWPSRCSEWVGPLSKIYSVQGTFLKYTQSRERF